MKRSETSLLLAKISAVDNRRVDPRDADLDDPTSTPILDSWHEILGDLNLQDCLEALLQHRRTTTDWVTPAHIIKGVKAIREERLRLGPPVAELMADVDPDIPGAEYAQIYRDRIRIVADGNVRQLRAIQGGVA